MREKENAFDNIICPVTPSRRYAILDILRGLALSGIAIANFTEFSLYSFLDGNTTEAMPTSGIDYILRYLQYIFIDGKFYTIFSLLFGIGFSIIISNAEEKGADSFRIFYRRMLVLLVIGFIHLMFIWSGDILVLYALLGLLLPLFRNMPGKKLLCWAAVLLIAPVAADTAAEIAGIHPSAPVIRWQQYYCAKYGITGQNFAYWLRDAKSYTEVFDFLIQGALVRLQEFIDGNRYFKVMGLFLIGYYIGRNKLYARLELNKPLLKRTALYGFAIGLPFSVTYAWSAVNHQPYGLALHSVLYLASVFPLGFAYVAAVCLCYIRHPQYMVFKLLAPPGQMALTNYIGQSLFGITIFYGIGFGLGARTGLIYVLIIATGIYIAQALFSRLWLHYFRFGPLEWLWRMLTYGRIFKLLK